VVLGTLFVISTYPVRSVVVLGTLFVFSTYPVHSVVVLGTLFVFSTYPVRSIVKVSYAEMCANVKAKQLGHFSGDLQKEFCYQRNSLTAIGNTFTLWKVRHNRCCYCLWVNRKKKEDKLQQRGVSSLL
jgi:hypothetical protein